MITPVILCGGTGTRLWPLSRGNYPKQFAKVMGETSLFQSTAARLNGPDFAAPIAVTTDAYRFTVVEQLAALEIAAGAVLVEPEARETAAAVLAGTLKAAEAGPESLVLVSPATLLMPDENTLANAVRAARPAAQDGRIVTFGLDPDSPDAALGYIEMADSEEALGPRPVTRFVDEPDAESVASMLAEGGYLCDSGILLFRADVMRAAFEAHAPGILSDVERAMAASKTNLGFTSLDADAYGAVEAHSVGDAVLQKADNLSVMSLGGSSDLNDWGAVWRASEAEGMATSGPALALDCAGSLLRSENADQPIVGIGLTDIVAIAMPDAVLVAHKDRADDVRAAVAQLHAAGHSQAHTHSRDYRPWGWYESLVIGQRFQVKRIVVHPGAALSLQSHHHRSEHWIVVEGTARVTVDEDVKLVTENESVYIPLGAVHRMENPGKVPMVLIEVQTGVYLGEDDIVRYEDVYARS